MGTIEQRLQVLERELHRSRSVTRILIVVVVAVVCIAGAQQNPPEELKSPQQSPSSGAGQSGVGLPLGGNRLRTVEADQFVLLDRFGRCRVRMHVTDDGPTINMFDDEGRKRLELGQTSSASGLRLFHSNESVVSLQLPANGDPAHLEIRNAQGSSLIKPVGVSVRDASNQGRLHLSLLNGNFPTLGISQSGQSGSPSIEMTASEGAPSLKIHDKNGFPQFAVAVADRAGTSLIVRHPDHERSLQISTGPKDVDGPVMSCFAPANEDGTGGLLPRLQLGLGNDGQPHVRIVGRDGKKLFAAPSD